MTWYLYVERKLPQKAGACSRLLPQQYRMQATKKAGAKVWLKSVFHLPSVDLVDQGRPTTLRSGYAGLMREVLMKDIAWSQPRVDGMFFRLLLALPKSLLGCGSRHKFGYAKEEAKLVYLNKGLEGLTASWRPSSQVLKYFFVPIHDGIQSGE